MGWFKISVDRDTFSSFFAFGTDASSPYYGVLTDSDGVTLIAWNSVATVSGSTALAVGTWYHIAAVVNGTSGGNFLTYLNGAVNITSDGSTNPAAGAFIVGSDPDSEWLNGCAAAIKVWSTNLTAVEIQQEMQQYLPIRTANLNAFYPCLSVGDDEVDFSGNGNTLTVGGTLATEDGPPIPWVTGRHRVLIPASGAPVLRFILGTH